MIKSDLVPDAIYRQSIRYFPIPCVDLIILKNDKFIFTLRTIEPYAGMWCLPGGMVHKGETIRDAALRIAKNELSIGIRLETFLGVYESFHKKRHDISHCFIASHISGSLKTDFQASAFRFFDNIPRRIPPHHVNMIKDFLDRYDVEVFENFRI